MNRPRSPRATKTELAIIRDIEKTSAFEKLDRGEAEIVHPQDYPEPMKRFLARERCTLHVPVSSRLRRRLEALNALKGITPDELARRWIEERIRRESSQPSWPRRSNR